MGIVINLFTKQVIKQTNQTKEKFKSNADLAKERIFDKDAKSSEFLFHLKKAEKEGANSPYIGGCFHSTVYGKKTCNVTGLYNSPSPIPVYGPVLLPVHLGNYVLGSGVLDSTGSDPFMWLDSKYEVTKNVLRQYSEKKLIINTRSDLIAHDDYIRLLDHKLHKINIYIFSDNERVSRLLEPGCPSVKRRLIAAEKLLSLGFDVTVTHIRIVKVKPKYNSIKLIKENHPKLKFKKITLDVSDDKLKSVSKILGELS